MGALDVIVVAVVGSLVGLAAGELSRAVAAERPRLGWPDRLSWLLAAGGAAALAAHPAWQQGPLPGAAQAALVGLLLLVLACDVRQRAVYPVMIFVGVVLAVLAGPILGTSMAGALLGAAVGTALFFGVYLVAGFRYGAGAFGSGDVYAAALLGAVVGLSRLPLALALVALVGVGLAVVAGLRARSMQVTFPYAPALCLAALVAPLLAVR
ncbi:MAG TPA: prepilin peptidase [Chloroflexota bacterium]|nr:prepilin peptidase [Chloroflexota bacterium]